MPCLGNADQKKWNSNWALHHPAHLARGSSLQAFLHLVSTFFALGCLGTQLGGGENHSQQANAGNWLSAFIWSPLNSTATFKSWCELHCQLQIWSSVLFTWWLARTTLCRKSRQAHHTAFEQTPTADLVICAAHMVACQDAALDHLYWRWIFPTIRPHLTESRSSNGQDG